MDVFSVGGGRLDIQYSSRGVFSWGGRLDIQYSSRGVFSWGGVLYIHPGVSPGGVEGTNYISFHGCTVREIWTPILEIEMSALVRTLPVKIAAAKHSPLPLTLVPSYMFW